jgi:hypothetical protein
MLFLITFALLLMAEGIQGIYRLATRWTHRFALILSGLPVLALIWIMLPNISGVFVAHPAEQGIKPVLKYVAENKAPDDTIYIFHIADPAFNYYAPFYNLDKGNILIGFDAPRKQQALRHFYADMEELKGRERVWFIFTEIAVECSYCSVEDTQTFYVEYLNSLGRMLDRFDAPGSFTFLYSLDE